MRMMLLIPMLLFVVVVDVPLVVLAQPIARHPYLLWMCADLDTLRLQD